MLFYDFVLRSCTHISLGENYDLPLLAVVKLVWNHGHALEVIHKTCDLLRLHVEFNIQIEGSIGYVVHAGMMRLPMALDSFLHRVHWPAVVAPHIAVIFGHLFPGVIHMFVRPFHIDSREER